MLQEEAWMAAEINAKGKMINECRCTDRAIGICHFTLYHRVGIDLGTQDVVLGESVAPLGTDVGREDVAEARARLLVGDGAIEGNAVERDEVARVEDLTEETEILPKLHGEGGGGASADIEGPQLTALLPTAEGM